ncbi:hypothetical protein GN156_14355 [bacterium LRH843]|nr:hypothetical protein [bacterium LRH843]
MDTKGNFCFLLNVYKKGTYSGNFSNVYKKGTKYFSFEGISTDEAIAIEEDDDGKYRKVIKDGKYSE